MNKSNSKQKRDSKIVAMGIKATQTLPYLTDPEINKEILHGSSPGMVFRPLFDGYMEAV